MEISTYTPAGHLTGMLDRDQRTAKPPIFDRPVFVVLGNNTSARRTHPFGSWTVPGREQPLSHRGPHPGVPGRTSPHASGRTGRSGNSWKSLHSLQFIVVVIVCLSVFQFPSTLAAPLSRKIRMASRMESRAKWINPCEFPEERGDDHDMSMEQASDKDMLKLIVDQANIAYNRAVHFAENYALRTFQMDMNQLHNSRRDWRYDWLPSRDQVPKDLFEPVPRDHLENLELTEALLNAYEYLQRVAVGMEQMVWDQEDSEGQFRDEVTKNERNLSNVLCELQAMIYHKNIEMRADITRDIMGDQYRHPSTQTDINNRDWIIIRDYMNVLEYVKDVFTYLGKK